MKQRGGRGYTYQVALPSLPPGTFQNSPKPEKAAASPTHSAGPAAHPSSVQQGCPAGGVKSAPPPARVCGCGRGDPACAPGGPGMGSLAPPFFGSTRRTIVLDGLIPLPKLQASAGGLKALTGVLGRLPPPRQDSHLPMCSGWVCPSARPLHPQLRSGNWDGGRKRAVQGKAFGGLSQLCRHSGTPSPAPAPHPAPHLIPCRNPNLPGPSDQSLPLGCWCSGGPGPHGPDLKMVVTETTLGHPLHPPDREGQQGRRP